MRHNTETAAANEALIARFRDWRLMWKPTDEQIDQEVACIRRLAEFITPVPLSKVTKAVMRDFHLEEQKRLLSLQVDAQRKAMRKNLHFWIQFDAFLADARKKKGKT